MEQNYSPSPLSRAIEFIWLLTDVVEGLLAFRFLLKLFGANPDAAFTAFMYTLTQPFVAPFVAVFPTSYAYASGTIFEWGSLLAMFVYWFIAWAIIRLFFVARSPEDEHTYHHHIPNQ
jgi:hypothetical protein